MFVETGSEPLRNKFNSILAGKLFVQFSDLEAFGHDWQTVSSKLKR